MIGIGLIWMLLVWGGIILLVVWLINTLFPTSSQNSQSEKNTVSAQQILDQRYARGELSQEEYREMRQTMEG